MDMNVIMLVKRKRNPTKKEADAAQKITDEAIKSGAVIERYGTYGAYDFVAVIKSSNKNEELYLRCLHTVKDWADVQTLPIIDSKLMDKIDREFVK